VAYDEKLADRVREIVQESADPVERKMFGGVAFMVGGHMCVGVINKNLVLRLGGDEGAVALKNPSVRPMDFTGRPMKNFLYVSPKATKGEKDLRKWIARGLTYVATLPPKEPKKARR
jgi:TfoX/Sxy family transcriptional regulator of competence genes